MATRKRKKKRGLAAARESMKRRGTLGSYGHHSDAQKKRDIKKGGKIAKKAQFALNMSRLAKKHKRTKKRTSRHRKRMARR
jgi:hypothetical protein